MISEQTIIEFIKDFSGLVSIHGDTDLFGEAKITGDDFHDLMEKYSKEFHVDMSTYLWYFHTDEEGQNVGAIVFESPNQLVGRIPITPKLLSEIANSGQWNISYPDHIVPKRRYDLLLNLIILLAFLGVVIYLAAIRFLA
jgi:hypothetical protein